MNQKKIILHVKVCLYVFVKVIAWRTEDHVHWEIGGLITINLGRSAAQRGKSKETPLPRCMCMRGTARRTGDHRHWRSRQARGGSACAVAIGGPAARSTERGGKGR